MLGVATRQLLYIPDILLNREDLVRVNIAI